MSNKMEVYIDGKKVKCLNDIHIVYPNQVLVWKDEFGGDTLGTLDITLNNEGMSADTTINGCDTVDKSMWKTLEDIIEETH